MPNEPISDAEFYTALGKATSAWQTIELALAELFVVALQSPRTERSSAAFDAIQNFRDKLAAVDAIVRPALSEATSVNEWNALNNKLVRLAKRRNRIAHAHVVYIHTDDGMKPFAAPPLTKIIPPWAAFDKAERQKVFRNQ